MLSRSAVRGVARATLAVVVMSSTGCFVYVPTELRSVTAGEQVQIRLTRQALVDLPELPVGPDPLVRGTVSRWEQDRVFVRVPVATRRDGFAQRAIEQELALAERDIVEVGRRQRSHGRTALMIGGTGGVAAMVIGLILKGGGARNNDDPGPPDEIRIPLGLD